MKIAIHNTFLPKENILFLEEWLDYHILLGFNKFYLYNNHKVNKIDDSVWDAVNKRKVMVLNKINKHSVDFDTVVNMTDEEIFERLERIVDNYKGMVEIIEWSPKDKDGAILFNQIGAKYDCLNRIRNSNDNIEWLACFDIDEFLNLNDFNNIKDYLSAKANDISNIQFKERRMVSRWYWYEHNPDKLITENNVYRYPNPHSTKYICKVKDIKDLEVHEAWTMNKKYMAPLKELWFNHCTDSNKLLDREKRNGEILINENNRFDIKRDLIEEIKNKSKSYIIKDRYNWE